MFKFKIKLLLSTLIIFIVITGSTFAGDLKYILGPNDVIEITVWNNPDLTRIITIRDDGYISFPLINEVKAEGLTPLELQDKIEALLENYIKSPKVTVLVREFKKIEVSVVGAVLRQGVYPVRPGTRLLEVLAMAGIVEETALLEEVTLSRNDTHFNIDVDKLLREGGHQNYLLQDGDVIYVPFLKREVYILGEVERPGNYPIDKNTTPLDVLAMAGGPTERADLKRVKIIHRTGLKEVEIINLEDYLKNNTIESLNYLQDGDIIQIEETKAIDWEKIFSYAAGIKVIHDLIVNW